MYTNALLLTFICTAMKLMGQRYIMVHILRENELEHIVDSSFDSKQLPATGPVIWFSVFIPGTAECYHIV